jgi:hypothetical protein
MLHHSSLSSSLQCGNVVCVEVRENFNSIQARNKQYMLLCNVGDWGVASTLITVAPFDPPCEYVTLPCVGLLENTLLDMTAQKTCVHGHVTSVGGGGELDGLEV